MVEVLEAHCGRVTGIVGSYGWYHSFRLTVNKLENGPWGSRFPTLMNHSDCGGTYSSKESVDLIRELIDIEKGFRKLPYPAARYLDKNGKELGYSVKYSEDGEFRFRNGYRIGVDDRGLFFAQEVEIPGSEAIEPLAFNMHQDGGVIAARVRADSQSELYITRLDEVAKGDEWFERWGTKPRKTSKIVYGHKPASQVFRETIDFFIKLSEESIVKRKPIVFC